MPTKQTLDMLGIPRTTFYRWYDRYVEGGFDALADRLPRLKSAWNRIPENSRDVVIKAADDFHDKTAAISKMWQTDFTDFKSIG